MWFESNEYSWEGFCNSSPTCSYVVQVKCVLKETFVVLIGCIVFGCQGSDIVFFSVQKRMTGKRYAC